MTVSSQTFRSPAIPGRFILLFSNFAAICTNQTLLKDINSLLNTRLGNNFFLFDKTHLKEQKNKYQIYSGAHMGLAENRNKKETLEIESTFYMLKILSNLHRNGVK